MDPVEGGQPNMLCSGLQDRIVEGRKSFPSGHSSFSFAVYVFAFLYISGKLRIFVKSRSSMDPTWSWKFIMVTGILLSKLENEHC